MGSHSAVDRAVLVFVVAAGVAASACHTGAGRAIDREAEMRAVEQAIDGTIEWAKTKDFNRLYGIIANDSAYLEVHPGDRVVRGFGEFRKMGRFWASPDFRAVRHEIRDLHISFSHSGDVAWFFCMLDDINEWKGQPASWINTRWTGVLEKREGNWRMVQMHFSNPVREQEDPATRPAWRFLPRTNRSCMRRTNRPTPDPLSGTSTTHGGAAQEGVRIATCASRGVRSCQTRPSTQNEMRSARHG